MTLIFSSILCCSVFGQHKFNDKLLKLYRRGDYVSVLRFADAIGSDEIVIRFKLYAQVSFEYGRFKKAAGFYEKILLLDRDHFKEKDVINYGYSLLKCNKEKEILSDTLFFDYAKKSKAVRQIVENAGSYDFYDRLPDSGIKLKKLNISGIIPRYGLSCNGNSVYFAHINSYKRNNPKKELIENRVFVSRMFELSRIGKVRLSASGSIDNAGTTICRLPRRRRIVTIYKDPQSNGEFYTVVPNNGDPEQIRIKGTRYPPFPYNATNYACAMPFLDAKNDRLYYCSNMICGHGGWDVYYIDFDGIRWSEPVNAGDEVNTPFDELFPAVYDNYLCFASDGLDGYGGFDNYAFDSKTHKRVNLYPFNSKGDDYSIRLAEEKPFRAVGILNKKPIFFSSNKKFTTLIDDIGQTIDSIRNGENSVEADDTIIATPDVSVNNKKDKVSFKKTGNQSSTIQTYNSSPAHEVKKTDLTTFLPSQETTMMTSGGKTRRIGEVFFELNSPLIRGFYYTILNDIVSQISSGKSANIIVWGYADRSGFGRNNDYLSYMRAHGVVEYLKSKLPESMTDGVCTIVAGEGYANGRSETEKDDRKVVISTAENRFPYTEIYAYRSLPGQTLNEIAGFSNNDPVLLRQMNTSRQHDLWLVGIQGIHMVRKGENMYRIAINYHCSLSKMQRLNKKANRNVLVGEKLIIPLADNGSLNN